MKPIKLIADSTCDLSPELLKQYNISVCPLQVNLGEQSLLDGVEATPEQVFDWAERNGKTPSTSAPSPDSIEKILREYSADNDVIAFTISSEMSSTYQTFSVIAGQIENARITVIDSRNLSTGIGLQIIFAAKLIEGGADYDTVVSRVREIIPKVRAGFIVDSVMYLHKGGRCSAMAAFGATALKLHPTLAVVDGVIKVDKKVRGDMLPATLKYGKGLDILSADDDMVFVTYSGYEDIADAQARELYDYVASFNKFRNIYVTRAGCVVSSHCGPGCIGILFIEK